jgi:hypothetical protein
MTQKLQELKMKIAEYNPDIMELKEGCILVNKKDAEAHKILRNVLGGDIFIATTNLGLKCKEINREYIYKDCEIIGRDINLEDILMALGIDCDNVEKKFGFRKAIEDLIFGWFDKKTKRFESWIFGKPLHEQDEPTINLLHNILC